MTATAADAVIGCDAVDVGEGAALRLTTLAGRTRMIPWSAIRLAGMGSQIEGHVTVQGVTEKVAPFLATHDSLWIVYAETGFAQVLIEKGASAKRTAVLAAFEKNLGGRWRDDELTESELTDAMLIPAKLRISKPLIMIFAMMIIAFGLLVAIAFYLHGARPTAP